MKNIDEMTDYQIWYLYYYLDNKERLLAQNRKYKANNKAKISAQRKVYRRTKKEENEYLIS